MKNQVFFKSLFVLCFSLMLQAANAGWYTDQAMNYKINVPENWTKQTLIEGTDKILDLASPDGSIAIQIRAFEVDAGVNAETLGALFKEGMLSEGATLQSQSSEYLNELQGVMGVFTNNYDGMDVGIISFSTVSSNIGYLIFTVIPINQFEQRAKEADAILNTFTILSGSEALVLRETLNQVNSNENSRKYSGNISKTETKKESGKSEWPHVALNILNNNGNNQPALKSGFTWNTGIKEFKYQAPKDMTSDESGYLVEMHHYRGAAGNIVLRYIRRKSMKGYETVEKAVDKLLNDPNSITTDCGKVTINGYEMHLLQSKSNVGMNSNHGMRYDYIVFAIGEDIMWMTFSGSANNFQRMEEVARHILRSFYKS